MTYLITYDLNKSDQNYSCLCESIKSLGFWAHFMDSTWFVDTDYSPEQIRDELLKVMDSNDSLFITKISSYAGSLLHKEAWPWLSEHVK
ncbi:hypothetical protein [Clostridium saccharoperbutylacetonicum]|uniref:hypothetical protein n=1 Tax=Clostridium saccharoperbutylacetonicum TaxID=36745 RepID=UPI000983B15C|nr:hypothetical protein [Clostridium saccharoperbutylacetonicum]AQR95533.1 hypothetical protein CLSAP_28490 [Clostridium saccharoperbutylacetonicum]NSB31393.1 hypothetical protein [Clostridium saccharoperbutylacetonicum]